MTLSRQASLRPARAGTLTTTSTPFRSGSSFPRYMCQCARRQSGVKLAVICGARSAFQRWSCSNFKCRCPRIHCTGKYNRRFRIHIHDETNFTFQPFQTRRDSRDGWFRPAREEEDSGASHKRRQTSCNLARGCKVVRAGHRR